MALLVSISGAGVPKAFAFGASAGFFIGVPPDFFSGWCSKIFLKHNPNYFPNTTMKKNFTFQTDEVTMMKLQVITGKGFINARDFQTLIQSLIDNTYEKKSKR